MEASASAWQQPKHQHQEIDRADEAGTALQCRPLSRQEARGRARRRCYYYSRPLDYRSVPIPMACNTLNAS